MLFWSGSPASTTSASRDPSLPAGAETAHTSIVRNAWQRGRTLAVNGWIYGLQDGLLRDLDTTVTQPDEVATSYREALSKLSRGLPP